MKTRVAINGFGRIGRLVLRAALSSKEASPLEWIAVNDLGDSAVLAHLAQFDSTFGTFPFQITLQGKTLRCEEHAIELLSVRDPKDLPWKKFNADYVVESTGRFTDALAAKAHIEAGAKRVLISAPAKNEDLTICMGINNDRYDPTKHFVLSNASCTTNCLAPLAKVLHENLGIDRGYMVTTHSYTNDQPTLDFPHKDLRRARAAALSMIPTTTGAARAIGLVLPELAGKLNGLAMRVPTPNVSIVALTAQVKKPTGREEVNQIFRQASESEELKKYLHFNQLPLVSKDFEGSKASAIFDATLTEVVDATLVNVFGWYDNEWGYANRVVDLLNFMAAKELPVKKNTLEIKAKSEKREARSGKSYQ